MNNTTVEICLVNLGNTGQFKYYDIQDMEDYKLAYQDMRDVFYADEIEIQGMSHSDYTVEYLGELLEIVEEHNCSLEDAINVFEATGCIHRTKEVIQDHLYTNITARDKEGAFIEYLEEIDFFYNIPDKIVGYLDYRKLLQDFQIEGLQIHQLGYTDNYLFIY